MHIIALLLSVLILANTVIPVYAVSANGSETALFQSVVEVFNSAGIQYVYSDLYDVFLDLYKAPTALYTKRISGKTYIYTSAAPPRS